MHKPLVFTLAASVGVVLLFPLANAQEMNKEKALATVSLLHAKKLSLAMLMYSQDYYETFPTGKTMAAIKPKLLPYHKDKSVYIDPTSGKDFVLNSNLDRVPFAAIEFPDKAVMFYSPVAHTDGMFTIAFTDGHCLRKKKVPPLNLYPVVDQAKPAVKPKKSGAKKRK